VEDLQRRAQTTRYIGGEDDIVQGRGEGAAANMLAQTDLPSLRDPRLFMIRCKDGREQEVVVALCNKFIASAAEGKRLAISCAFTTSKGVIFVESHREAFVRAAVLGIPDLYAGRPGSIKMMDLQDMPSAVTVKAKTARLEKGGWVRMLRGDYKGDLAKVEDVLSGGRVVVRAVPRINFQRLGMTAEQRRSLKSRGARPAQRLYNREDVIQAGRAAGVDPRIETRNFRFGLRCDYFLGGFYHEGFLLRECPVGHVTTEGAEPAMEELRLFRPRPDAADDDEGEAREAHEARHEEWKRSLTRSLGSGKKSAAAGGDATVVHGDAVVIVSGDLQGITGRVKSINEADGTAMVEMDREMAEELGAEDDLNVPVADLAKTFDVGARVKVVAGMHTGQTGVVLLTQASESGDYSAILTLDSGGTRVEVLVQNLRTTREEVTSVGSLQGFQLFDLVDIPSAGGQQADAGCIVAVGATDLTILDTANKAMRLTPSEVRHRRAVRAAASSAPDSTMRQVRAGDTVKVCEGEHYGTDGVVKHVCNAHLFVHTVKVTKNSGIFAVRSRSTTMAGGRRQNMGASAAAAALGIAGAGVVAPAGMGGEAGRGTGGLMVSSGGAGRGFGRGRGRGAADPDQLLGATVRILRGTHKQKLGVVRQLQGESVLVELHAGQRKVTVPKSVVRREDAGSVRQASAGMSMQELRAMSRAAMGGAAGARGPGTAPYQGGGGAAYRTAAYSSRTPALGGVGGTAAYSGRTPGLGGATPGYGSRTPGLGGATPGYGGRTPGLGGSTPAYGGGSTPAYGGGTTPGYSGADGSATASMWQASTPGPDLTADEMHEDAPEEPSGGGAVPAHALPGARVVITAGASSGKQGVVTEAPGASAVRVQLASGQAVTVSAESLAKQVIARGDRVFRPSDGMRGVVEAEVPHDDDAEVLVRFDGGSLDMTRVAELVPVAP